MFAWLRVVFYPIYIILTAVWFAFIMALLYTIGLFGIGIDKILYIWANVYLLIVRVLFGIKVVVKGKMPAYRIVIAANHQSAVDGILILSIAPKTVIFFRKDLPIISHLLSLIGMIPVNGVKGWLVKAQQVSMDTHLCIFPEGERVLEGEQDVKYKTGITVVGACTMRGIQPIIMHSGLFWGKWFFPKIEAFNKTLTIEILELLPCTTSTDVIEQTMRGALAQQKDALYKW